jgi:hypothetical protein
MSIPSPIPFSTAHTLRETTNQKRPSPFAAKDSKRGRLELTPSKSATCVREADHDCGNIEEVYTSTKAIARLHHSLFRFSLAHAFDCTTIRGVTIMNGAVSHCGGCQAGHAALSPTLYDNILETISEKLSTKKLDELYEHEQSYVQTRFAPTMEELEKLSSDDEITRTEVFGQFITRLKPHETKGTFVGTLTEKARNATYDNPTASNRLDCYLEQHLRPLEDELAAEKGEPIPALAKLQTKYRELIDTAIENLNARYPQLDELQKAWDTLMDAQKKITDLEPDFATHEADFHAYAQAVETALKAKKVFFEQLDGTPGFKSFKDKLDAIQSPYNLKNILKLYKNGQIQATYDYFKKNEKSLKTDSNITNEFIEVRNEISLRIHEASIQHKVLDQNHDEIKFMMKHFFGDLNPETKTLLTPNKEKIQQSILRLIPPQPAKIVEEKEVNPVCKALFS